MLAHTPTLTCHIHVLAHMSVIALALFAAKNMAEEYSARKHSDI